MQENSNQIILPKDVEEELQQYNVGDIAETGSNVAQTVAEVASEEMVGTVIEGVFEVIGGFFSALSD